MTTKRFPNGVEAGSFIEKNVPRHAPDWVRTVVIDRKSKGADTNQYAVVDDLATLVWFANLASIEFHTPMWRIERSGEPKRPDLIVFDLDPGEPASIVECCQVALLLRDRLASDRLALLPKTSGSKGLQLYGALGRRGWTGDEVNAFAHEVAEAVETDRATARRLPHDKEPPAGEDPHRLEPEQPGEDDRHAVLDAGAARTVGVDAGHVGRGRAMRLRWWLGAIELHP